MSFDYICCLFQRVFYQIRLESFVGMLKHTKWRLLSPVVFTPIQLQISTYIYIYTVYYIILCYYLMTHIYICLHTIYPIYPPRISVIGVTDWPTSQHVRVPHFTKLFITHPIQIKTRLSFRRRAENGLYMLRV